MADDKNKVTHEIYADASQANAALQQHTEEWKKLSQQIQLSIKMFRQFYQTAGSNLSWDHANKAFAKGSFTGQVNDTAVRALINNVRNEFDAAVRRLQKAMHDEQVKAIRQTQDRFRAQLEMERRRSDPGRINAGLRIDAANNSPGRLSERVLTAEMRAQDHSIMARLELAERKFSSEFTRFRLELDRLRNSQARLDERLRVETLRSAPHMIRERLTMADRQFSEGRSAYRLDMDALRNSSARLDENLRREQIRSSQRAIEERLTMLERRVSEERTRYRLDMDSLRYDPRRMDANLRREQILNRPDVLQERITMLERRNAEDRIRYRQEMDALKFDPRRMNERLGDERRLTQFGAAGSSNLRTWDRLNNNGGADMMAIQARLMGNYQVIAGAFNSARWMGRFMVDLDKEFRQLQAIAGMTYTEMDKLEGSLIRVSEATKFTAVEVAQASVLLAQAGLSGREVSETIDSVALLATAAGTDLTQAVDVATSTLGIFNLQTAEMGNVANVLTAALNKSKLTIDKIALGFQYAGNIAAQSGISFTELTAILGALANSGIRSGSTLGTGLRQLIVDLEKPSEGFSAVLKELNLTLADVDVKTKGFTNVINTLADAGFTASDAFQTFEVRAAAAYAALANNIGLANSLQREFLLTSAAVEANEVQMEALSNTWRQFQSVVGSAAYRAFKPVLGLLQDLLRALSSFIAKVTESETALRLLGIAITAAGFGAMVAGITRLVSGLVAFTGALAATTTGATAATSAMAALTMAMRINPVVALASAVAGLATAFYSLGESRSGMDQLQASINEVDSEISATEQKLAAIQQTISNLRQQESTLEADPESRITKILEIKQAFSEVTNEVSTTTGSIREMIEALEKLNSKLAGTQASSFALKGTRIEKMLEKLRGQRQGLVEDGAGVRSLQRALGYGRSQIPDSLMVGGREENLRAGLQHLFGSDAIRVLDILQGGEQASEYDLQNLRNTFKQQTIKANTPKMRAAAQAVVDAIDTQLNLIMKIVATEQQLKTNRYQASGEAAKRWTDGLDKIGDQLFADVNKALDDTLYGRPAAEHPELVKKVEEQFRGRIEAYQESLDQAAAAVANELQFLSPEEAQARVSETHSGRRGAAVGRTFAAARDGKYDATIYQTLQDTKVALDQNKQEMDRIAEAGRKAADTIAIQALRDRLVALAEEEKRLILKQLELEHAGDSEYFSAKGGMTAKFRQEADDATRKVDVDLVKRLGDLNSNVARISEDAQKKAIDDMKEEYRTLEKKLRQLAEGVKRLPLSELDAAMRAIELLGQQMQGLSGSIATAEGNLYQPTALGRGASANAPEIARKIIEEANRRGVDPIAALSVASSESNFDPSVKNDKSTAFGLFQIIDRTFQRLHGGKGTMKDRLSVDQQIKDGLELMYRVQNDPELLQLLGRTPNATDHKLAHMRGLGGYKEMLRNPNARVEEAVQKANDLPAGATNQDFMNRFGQQLTNEHILRILPYLDGYTNHTPAAVVEDQKQRDIGAQTTIDQTQGRVDNTKLRATIEKINKTEGPVIAQNIETLMVQMRRFTDPARVEAQIPELEKQFDELRRLEMEKYELQKQDTKDRASLDREHSDLLNQIEAERARKMLDVIRARDAAVEKAAQKPVAEAEAKVEGARRHGAPNFQIREMEGQKLLAEEAALTQTLIGYKETLVSIERELNAAKQGTPEYNMWLQQQAEQLEKIAQLQSKVNALKTAPEQKQAVDYIRNANQEFLTQQGLLKQNKDGTYRLATAAEQAGQYQMTFAQGLSGAFKGLFTDLITGTEDAGEALRKFALNLANVFADIASQILTNQIMQALLGPQGEGGFLSQLFAGGGNLFSGLLGGGAPMSVGPPMLLVPVAHSGGVVGKLSTRRAVPLDAFRGARRYHSGGVIGRNEQPILAELGEEVLTRNDWRHRRNLQHSDPFSRGSSRRSMEVSRTERAKRQPDRNVNVWVVSRDQVPPPGPDDIVHTIADNINRGGVVRQLVKKVALNG